MFRFNILVKNKPHTRRNILSMVSSIYDPLGFLSPLTLSAKLLLQDLCRNKCSWDHEVPKAALESWRKWVASLDQLENFSVERCVKPSGIGAVTQAELHHFSDASDHAWYSKLSTTDIRNTYRACSFHAWQGQSSTVKTDNNTMHGTCGGCVSC